MTHVTRT